MKAIVDIQLKKAISKHNAKKFAEARKLYSRILKKDPGHLDANYLLGTLYSEINKQLEAEKYLKKAETIAPLSPMVQNNLGILYFKQKRLEEASNCFFKAIKIKPNFTSPYLNLGNIAKVKGDIKKALEYYQKALGFDSTIAEAHFQIGKIRFLQKDINCLKYFEEALKFNPQIENIHKIVGKAYLCFNWLGQAQTVLEVAEKQNPKDLEVQYFLCIAKGKQPDANLKNSYLENEFDNFANSFDKTLFETLEYNIPEFSRNRIENVLGDNLHFEKVIDLGCGTGMNGLAFRDCSEYIAGIDLSEKMIVKASEKKCYDKLIHGEILDELERLNSCFDLFIANDVFVYLGDLEDLFCAISNKAKSNSCFVFSTESYENGSDSYVLLKSGRFAHNPTYIRKLAEKYRWKAVFEERVNIRKEFGEWVQGDLFLLTLNDS